MAALKFDPNRGAVINPWDCYVPVQGCPKTAVSSFPHNLVKYAVEKYGCEFVRPDGSGD